eukprot:jgi/Chlat1/9143/Chrsp97S08392
MEAAVAPAGGSRAAAVALQPSFRRTASRRGVRPQPSPSPLRRSRGLALSISSTSSSNSTNTGVHQHGWRLRCQCRVEPPAEKERAAEDEVIRAVFNASYSHAAEVEERERPLAQYMTLPASQYSVLDAKRIERIDDKTFICYVGGIHFFNFEVQPVLTVRVDEEPTGCTIRLLDCKASWYCFVHRGLLIYCRLEGPAVVTAQNDKFSASMVNKVSYSDVESSTNKCIRSDTTLQVQVGVPRAFRFLGVDNIGNVGSRVMKSVLGAMVPRFTEQLSKDYYRWAAGDDSRQPDPEASIAPDSIE